MKIVIIGGGFAGLKLARELNNKKGFEIMLLDKVTFHQFQPLFYQVATASLEASNISFPLRKVFHNSKNVRIRFAEVEEIKPEINTVVTDICNFEYDLLVLATGTQTNFFGNQQIQSHAFPMKTTFEALRLMNRIINNFEDALEVNDDAEKSRIMSIAIVGAGPTGVELAGALAEMRKNILPKDYPELNWDLMHIYLIDHNKNPLSAMSEKSSNEARKYLQDLGIILKLGAGVEEFDGERIVEDNGEIINVKTVIWAAGVRGNLPEGIPPENVARGNRVKVDRFNKVIGSGNIYAIGDIAYMETDQYPNGHPQLASVAGDQGEHLAKNLIRLAAGDPPVPFEFDNKGVMATIGKRKAVVDLEKPKIHFKGRIAWFIWMFLHLMLILGIKNKLQIFINWAYKYFTSDQSLRLAQRIRGKGEELQIFRPPNHASVNKV
ncbi:NAD(P)/FAD-dependent oxidoreductase [Mucilaginibacter roseus]|uniref:NADH:ubiquinone reductase (non-electrogenic) n=1 Tax=Mucilaginibacter roseus TaxID=1528868 RepID=A0ABS8U2W3_9SPHI|nr:NAD(P)/FAD-dependent oxidoreductase [Mucilaginibacter roseus]MCD8740400.1 NAD(P)/FAD-dependent oxidoreductase [Mucilaginibacter roseus]